MANAREESLDRRARRLVQATEEAVRRHLSFDRLEPGLISELYLRAREVLAHVGAGASVADVVEDVSIALYLAVLAREETTGPGLLASLRRALADAVCEPGTTARTASRWS